MVEWVTTLTPFTTHLCSGLRLTWLPRSYLQWCRRNEATVVLHRCVCLGGKVRFRFRVRLRVGVRVRVRISRLPDGEDARQPHDQVHAEHMDEEDEQLARRAV